MTLTQTFADVCRDYFPRWRNAVYWTVREGSRAQWVDAQGETWYTMDYGYCDIESRTIWLSDTSKATIIHEICHAVTGSGHGKRFWARMRRAAQRAEALGATELAEQLSREVDTCEGNVPSLTARYVYRRVDDIVRDMPHLTFDALKNDLAAEMLMTSPELCKRYRRLRQVFEEAKKEWAC